MIGYSGWWAKRELTPFEDLACTIVSGVATAVVVVAVGIVEVAKWIGSWEAYIGLRRRAHGE